MFGAEYQEIIKVYPNLLLGVRYDDSICSDFQRDLHDKYVTVKQ